MITSWSHCQFLQCCPHPLLFKTKYCSRVLKAVSKCSMWHTSMKTIPYAGIRSISCLFGTESQDSKMFYILRDMNDFCRCQICLWAPFINSLLGQIRALSGTGSSLHGKLFQTRAHCFLNLLKLLFKFFSKRFSSPVFLLLGRWQMHWWMHGCIGEL